MEANTHSNSVHDLRRKLDLLLRTGQLLVESSANTDRIKRNMKRTAAFFGLPEENLHIYIDYKMLMVNFSDAEHSFSKFQRCEKHGINFTAISAISKLTFRAVREDYSIDQFEEELNTIKERPRNYSPRVTAIGAAFACGGFCIQFGCDWIAFLLASICAYLGFRARFYLLKAGVNLYMSIAIAAFVSTFAAWLTTFLPGWTTTPLHPLLACALFIVPGVPLINFVDDMMEGIHQVGLIRATNTAMMMVGMAFGIAFALMFCGITFGFKPDIMGIPMVPHHQYWEYALAAAISGMGFSMIFNIPKRLLWVAALGAIIAVCTRNFVSLRPDECCSFSLGLGGVIGSLAGSALVSLIALKAVHWLHTPNHVITISSVIPMVPGVLMYRALYSFIQVPVDHETLNQTMSAAVVNGVSASMMIFCIALGVAIPNVFARRFINRNKRMKFNKLIEERKDRGDFIYLEDL